MIKTNHHLDCMCTECKTKNKEWLAKHTYIENVNNVTTKTKQKHTEKEWCVDGFNLTDIIYKNDYGAYIKLASFKHNSDLKDVDKAIADCRHAVKCVNSHHELVDSCKQALEFIVGHIPEYGNEYLLVEKLEQVIKKAGE